MEALTSDFSTLMLESAIGKADNLADKREMRVDDLMDVFL